MDKRMVDKKKRILMVVSNPATSSTTGWPVGFWAAELTHAYKLFTEKGYNVTIASPKGGKVEVDSLSDPRDSSGYSKEDLISLQFLQDKKFSTLLENTKKVSDLEEDDFAARVVGKKVMPFRIEDEARNLGADFKKGNAFEAFAIRDGNLITGQQQHSGAEVAKLVID